MIKKLRLQYSVPLSCRVLNVSESRYYEWLNRKPSEREKEDMRLEVERRQHISVPAGRAVMRGFRKIWLLTE